jgi:hypothetical protein
MKMQMQRIYYRQNARARESKNQNEHIQQFIYSEEKEEMKNIIFLIQL